MILVATTSVLLGVKRDRVQAGALPTAQVASPRPAAVDRFDFFTLWISHHPQPGLPIQAQAAFLVDLDTRMVVWQRDPETMRAPASLTKMITAMVAFDDAGSLDRTVEVEKEATLVDPTLMGLTAGEHLTVRELMYGLFLTSGNDAAEALARGIVPRERFIRQMNLKAKSIGLRSSHFANPTGFDDPDHGMSAHDLARVAGYLQAYYPELAAIADTKDQAIPSTQTHKAFYPHNLNRLLWSYPGVNGLKTGFTDAAGACAVITASRDGRHLVAVVMNATGHSFQDAAALLDYGFSVNTNIGLGSLRSA